MKTLKSDMKKLFTAVLCFLMNLIPGKKLMKMINDGQNVRMDKNLEVNRFGQVLDLGKLRTKNKYYNAKDMKQRNKYINAYVNYLYEYIDYWQRWKNNSVNIKPKVSFVKFEDTG